MAARGVTLPDIKYVFIHPYCRTTVLHQSGLDALGEQRIDAELMANMTGRGGRTASDLVFYFFEFDDSEEALLELEESRQQPRPRVARASRRPESASQPSASRPSNFRAPPMDGGMTEWTHTFLDDLRV